jgi:hypothetical protein
MIEECICSLMVKNQEWLQFFVSGGARAGFGI